MFKTTYSDGTVTICNYSDKPYEYDGTEKTPTVTVVTGGQTLVENVDYKGFEAYNDKTIAVKLTYKISYILIFYFIITFYVILI